MLINSIMFISIAVQSQNEIIYNNEESPNTMQNNMITSYNHNCVKEARLRKKKTLNNIMYMKLNSAKLIYIIRSQDSGYLWDMDDNNWKKIQNGFPGC